MTEKRRKPRHLTFVLLDAAAKDLGLTMSEKAVLVALVKCLNSKRNGTAVWPGNPTIAAEIGAHLETVVKAKRSLHEKGFIKIRRDTGKSDVCTIDRDYIRALIDPPEKPGDTPPKNREGTGKGTAKLNSSPDFPSFSCSPDLKVEADDHQRKLALVGLVAQVTDGMRFTRDEQPTGEKKEDPEDPRILAAGARQARERPG